MSDKKLIFPTPLTFKLISDAFDKLARINMLNPSNLINNNYNILREYETSLNNMIDKKILNSNHKLEYLINSLNLVNPLNILSKGYSLVKYKDKLVNDASNIKINDMLEVKFAKGSVLAEVKEVNDGK